MEPAEGSRADRDPRALAQPRPGAATCWGGPVPAPGGVPGHSARGHSSRPPLQPGPPASCHSTCPVTSELLISAPISQRMAPLQCGHVLPRPPCPAVPDPPPSETPKGNQAGTESRQRKAPEEGSPVTAPTETMPKKLLPRTQGDTVPALSLPPSTDLPKNSLLFSLKERSLLCLFHLLELARP